MRKKGRKRATAKAGSGIQALDDEALKGIVGGAGENSQAKAGSGIQALDDEALKGIVGGAGENRQDV